MRQFGIASLFSVDGQMDRHIFLGKDYFKMLWYKRKQCVHSTFENTYPVAGFNDSNCARETIKSNEGILKCARIKGLFCGFLSRQTVKRSRYNSRDSLLLNFEYILGRDYYAPRCAKTHNWFRPRPTLGKLKALLSRVTRCRVSRAITIIKWYSLLKLDETLNNNEQKWMLNSYVDLTQNSVIQSTQFDLDYGVAAVSRALTPKSRISINRGVFLKLNFLFSRLRFDSKTARITT